MKPPVFEYHAPSTIPEAVALLGTLDNARLLAGGQSLMPMLNMRFAFPDHVIDLNRVQGLSGITQDGPVLRIGAMTRQRDIQEHPVVRERLPLLAEALSHVGHRQTRNRGTIGGSLCHLDPAAELVSVATALDAALDVIGPGGAREVPMAEFAIGFMTSALEPDEMLTAIRLPLPPRGHGAAFVEFSRRHGDYALVSAAVLMTLAAGRIEVASITLGGVGAVPLRLREAETVLLGRTPDADLFARAAACASGIEAMEDAQVPSWYRQRLAVSLTRRALGLARSRIEAEG